MKSEDSVRLKFREDGDSTNQVVLPMELSKFRDVQCLSRMNLPTSYNDITSDCTTFMGGLG